LCIAAGAFTAVIAQAVAGQVQTPPADEQRQEMAAGEPSLQELLEFIGQWETGEGAWIDPGDLEWLLPGEREGGNDEPNG
jgi:hypothetical protein